MEYSFNIEHAKKYGVEEAIIIKNFQFWINKNKANNKNFHNNHYWTFNTATALSKLFKFWTENQIRRILKSLIDQEVLITGNYNKSSYDRTTWYAFKDEPIFTFVEMEVDEYKNQNEEMQRPIPDNNTDNNINNNIDTKVSSSAFPAESAHNKSKTLSEINKDKKLLPDSKYKNGFLFVDYWARKPHLTTHKPATKTYSEAARKFCLLLSGNFGRYYTVNQEYMVKNKIDHRDLYKKWTPEEIYEAIDRYDDLLSGQYGLGSRDKLTTNCSQFLFNERTGNSIFLTKVGNGHENKSYQEKPLKPEIVEKYHKTFFPKSLNDVEEQELIKCVNFVVYREQEYRDKIKGVLDLSKLRGDKFFDMHIKFLTDKYYDLGYFQLNYIKWRWAQYLSWLKQEYGPDYELRPDNRFLKEMMRRNEQDSAFDRELERKEEDRQYVRAAFERGASYQGI